MSEPTSRKASCKKSAMISCDHHDYFEIVCMRQARVRVLLKNASILEGVAQTIRQHEGREYLVLDTGATVPLEIELTEIKQLTGLDGVSKNIDLRL
ncbi:MAG: transcriptional regulator [Hahellaceae bacterium]|nr:transcriptional regulator [Hahellaceae bacterium]